MIPADTKVANVWPVHLPATLGDIRAGYCARTPPRDPACKDSAPLWRAVGLSNTTHVAQLLERWTPLGACMLAVADGRGACVGAVGWVERALASSPLAGADLRGADLCDADLTGADLEKANLRGADLRRAGLRGAFLGRANLARADLTNADLTNADLTGANFTNADLRYASLAGASLDGANFTGANLYGTDTTGAHNIPDSLLAATGEVTS